MTDYRRSLRRGLGALAVLGVSLATTAGYAASGPHIAVRPRSVMVNTRATLTGSGFPANSSIRLQECGAAAWIDPQNPCDSANEITVTTGAKGAFTTTFAVQLCPRELPPKPPVTRERCYIGEPQSTGEDTAGLLGAAKLTVTYP